MVAHTFNSSTPKAKTEISRSLSARLTEPTHWVPGHDDDSCKRQIHKFKFLHIKWGLEGPHTSKLIAHLKVLAKLSFLEDIICKKS